MLDTMGIEKSFLDSKKLATAHKAVKAANRLYLKNTKPIDRNEPATGNYLYYFSVTPSGIGPSIHCVIPYTDEKIDVGNYDNY